MNPEIFFSFGIWLLYGFHLRKKFPLFLQKMGCYSIPMRIFFGVGGLLFSGAILLFGMVLMSKTGAMQEGKLSYMSWLIMSIMGLFFVHIQVFSMSAMLSLVPAFQVYKRRDDTRKDVRE